MSSIVSNETIIYGHRRRIRFNFEFHSTGVTTGNYFIEYCSQLIPCRLFICFVIKTCTTYIDTYTTASPTRQTFVCHCLHRINAHQANRSKNINITTTFKNILLSDPFQWIKVYRISYT